MAAPEAILRAPETALPAPPGTLAGEVVEARPRAARVAAWAEGIALGLGGALLALAYALTFRSTSDAFVALAVGVAYADQVALAQWEHLLHPHHILYHLVAYGLSRIFVRFTDPLAAALLALRLLSAVAGGAAAVLCYRLLRRLSVDRLAASVTTLTMAGAAGFWLYAGGPDTHMPAIAASFGVLLVLARALDAPTPRACAWVGLAHALAVALRQDALLLTPFVLAVVLCWGGREGGWTRGAAYGAGLSVPVALLYMGVYLTAVRGRGRFQSLAEWGTMYAHWGQWGLAANVTWANFLLTVDGVVQAVSVHLDHPLFAPGMVALALGAAPAVRALAVPQRLLACACVAWVAVRLAFFTWWDPLDAFHYGVATAAPLFVLAGLAAGGVGAVCDGRRRTFLRAALASLVPVMAWTNWSGFVRPMAEERHFAEAARWGQAARPADLILSNNNPLIMALKYMARLDAVQLPLLLDPAWGGMNEGRVRELIRERAARGGRVFLTADVMEERIVLGYLSAWNPVGRFEQQYPAPGGAKRAVAEGFRWRVLDLGDGPRGRAYGYELVGPAEVKGAGHGG